MAGGPSRLGNPAHTFAGTAAALVKLIMSYLSLRGLSSAVEVSTLFEEHAATVQSS
jgi:hypothetical protein